uniref:Uncharacterized protein n=1 Tax=Triticum aestivum TaxID=4565 RepID=A0A3B6KIH4_WHEAT
MEALQPMGTVTVASRGWPRRQPRLGGRTNVGCRPWRTTGSALRAVAGLRMDKEEGLRVEINVIDCTKYAILGKVYILLKIEMVGKQSIGDHRTCRNFQGNVSLWLKYIGFPLKSLNCNA